MQSPQQQAGHAVTIHRIESLVSIAVIPEFTFRQKAQEHRQFAYGQLHPALVTPPITFFTYAERRVDSNRRLIAPGLMVSSITAALLP